MIDLKPGQCIYIPNGVLTEEIKEQITKGSIKRMSDEVYYKFGIGILGEIPFDEDYFDNNVLIGKDQVNGYLTSHSFFNLIGLTTQVPVKRFIVTNIDAKDVKLHWTKVIKPKIKVNEENWRILQFLDFLEGVDYIACFNADVGLNYLIRFFKWIKEKNEERLELLIILSELYSKELQAKVVKLLYDYITFKQFIISQDFQTLKL